MLPRAPLWVCSSAHTALHPVVWDSVRLGSRLTRRDPPTPQVEKCYTMSVCSPPRSPVRGLVKFTMFDNVSEGLALI